MLPCCPGSYSDDFVVTWPQVHGSSQQQAVAGTADDMLTLSTVSTPNSTWLEGRRDIFSAFAKRHEH